MTYRTSIDIDAPPSRVWEVWMDVEGWPRWCPTMTSVQRIEKGMFRTGSNVRIKQPRLPEAMWRVASLKPEEAFTWSSRSRGVLTEARHVVKPREGGGATAESHLRQTGPLAWLAKLFFSRLTRRYLQQESEALKIRCEAGRGPV
jgi:uncharacterized protein YndB with AHSA1/START domain